MKSKIFFLLIRGHSFSILRPYLHALDLFCANTCLGSIKMLMSVSLLLRHLSLPTWTDRVDVCLEPIHPAYIWNPFLFQCGPTYLVLHDT